MTKDLTYMHRYLYPKIGKNCYCENQMIMGTKATLLSSLIPIFRLIRALQSEKKDLKVYCHDLSNIYTHKVDNEIMSKRKQTT